MGVFNYKVLGHAVSLTFEDRAKITIHEGTTVDENFQTVPKAVVLYDDLPCRISKGGAGVSNRYNVAQNSGSATLFTGPDIMIPDSSIIEVTRAGQVRRYKRTADVMHYKSHNEYSVELNGGLT